MGQWDEGVGPQSCHGPPFGVGPSHFLHFTCLEPMWWPSQTCYSPVLPWQLFTKGAFCKESLTPEEQQFQRNSGCSIQMAADDTTIGSTPNSNPRASSAASQEPRLPLPRLSNPTVFAVRPACLASSAWVHRARFRCSRSEIPSRESVESWYIWGASGPRNR